MAKTFTFALRLSRLQRSRSNRKPSPLQTSRLSLPPADGMIRVFFHEPCRLSKQWPRSFFAITRCGKTRSVAASPNRLTQSPQRTQRDDGERNCQADFGRSFRCSHQARSGLLESVYEVVLAYELQKRGLTAERQKPMPKLYDNIRFDEAFRSDLVVNGKVIAELKSVEALLPVHAKQLLTQLRLSGLKLGFSSISAKRT